MRLSTAFWVFIGILISIQPLRSHDHEHAENNEWLKSLTNNIGGSCCDGSDAFSVLDVDWRRTDDPEFPFIVQYEGKILKVHKNNVVKQTNKIGVSKLWPVQQTDDGGEPTGEIAARCFMPGTET